MPDPAQAGVPGLTMAETNGNPSTATFLTLVPVPSVRYQAMTRSWSLGAGAAVAVSATASASSARAHMNAPLARIGNAAEVEPALNAPGTLVNAAAGPVASPSSTPPRY